MAKTNLDIIINAKDNASGVLGRIGGSIRTLGGIALGAGVVGIAAMGAGLALAVGEARESIAVNKELGAVLKSTGGIAGITATEARDLASSLQAVTNFTDEAVLKAESMLLTFTNIGEDIFPEATEATLNLAQKFGSVEQASVQLGKALNDPIEGVTALRRVGVMLTDQQEDQIKRFMEIGDIAGAQRVILAELGTEFGGLARAAADPITQLWNALADVGEEVGMAVVPALTALAKGALPIVQSAMEKLQPILGAIGLFGTSLLEGKGFLTSVIAGMLGLGASAETAQSVIDFFNDFQTKVAEVKGVVTNLFTTFQAGGLFGSRSGSFGSEGLLNALGIPPGIIDTIQTTFDGIAAVYTGFLTGGIFGKEMLTPGGTAETGGMLRAMGLTDKEVDSVRNSIDGVVRDAERIGEAFGKIFAAGTGENAESVNALVQILESIAFVMERIAAAGDVAAQIRAISDALGGFGGATNEIIKEGTGIDIAGTDAWLKSFGMSQQGLVGSFQSSVNNTPANQVGMGGQFGGSIDWAAFGQMIVSALQSAPPPVVNVSATLNGKEIAQDVSATLGSQAQSLARQGGFNAR